MTALFIFPAIIILGLVAHALWRGRHILFPQTFPDDRDILAIKIILLWIIVSLCVATWIILTTV